MSLVIQSLEKSFNQGENKIRVLKNLSAEIQPGEIVSIVGQSGSGKSTLLSLLAGLEKPDSGAIVVDGKDMVQMNEREVTDFRAHHIAVVFQQYHLVNHLTALENVMLPLEILNRPEAEKKATELLSDVGLGHRLHHFPTQLSGGECQRVAIARALVVEPKLLLADEPSGNLDTETGEKVMEKFFESAKKYGTTTLLVTHSPELARRCQRVFNLSSGQLVEETR